MEFEIKDLNPTKKAVSFKFFKEEIEREKKDVVNKIKKMANLPGFRPGKVPTEIIKARFKKEIEEDVLGNLIEKNVQEILKEKDWKLIGEVIFQDKVFEEEFFKAEVEFYILPKIEIPSLENLDLKKEEVEVSEKEVEEEIENYKKSKGFLENSEGPVKEENLVLCKLQGSYEGEEKVMDFGFQYLSPTGKDPVPELLGKNLKEEFSFFKDFPPDDPSPHRGKKVNFKGTIEEIKLLKYPELDLDFIKKDFPEINSMEEFKDFLRKKILEQKKRNAEDKLREDLINQLLARVDIPVPEPLLENEKRRYLQQVALSLYEKNYDINKMDWEKITREYEPRALKNLQKQLLLQSFAENLKIEISDEEVLKYIKKYCDENNLDYEREIKVYRQKGIFEEVREDLRIERTQRAILEKLGLQI